MIEYIVQSRRNQCVAITVTALLLYIPFINKALHLDADMLIHTSRQFLVDPVNPPLGEYGRHMVLHDHTKMPESSVFYRTGHPPLLPLLLTPVIAVTGLREWPLHAVLFAFFLLSVFSVWGLLGLFYDNAFQFFGTLIWALSPALFVNSSNIMWDVAITSLMLASLTLFLYALRSSSQKLLVVSGVFAGFAALTKVNALPLFIVFPGYLLLSRRWKAFLLWTMPAVVLPLIWVAHNIIVYQKIQYLSIGWFSFFIGDVRYRMERNISYFGGALLLPVFWTWLIVARRRFTELAISLLLCGVWGVLLIVVLKKPVWQGIAYTLFAAMGLWPLWRMIIFFHGAKSGAYRPYEPAIITAFVILYILVLNIMPSASMRYILPLVPIGLFIVGEELSDISERHRWIFLLVSLATGGLSAVFLSIGDYLQCEADRQLPLKLTERGYKPAATWYYGRLSYDWYLYHAGFKNLRIGPERPTEGEYLINETVPGDYKADQLLPDDVSPIPVDTIRFYAWPLRTRGFGAGFYGNDRLPYALFFGAPQKEFVLYRLH